MKNLKIYKWWTGGNTLSNVVTDYVSRVVTAGGTISSQNQNALNTFYNTLNTAGIWSKIIDIGLFMGGNLTASLVKFKYADSSIKTCVNSGFINGDYSDAGGVLSTVGTKYVDTQVAPSTWGCTKNNFSHGVFMTQDNNTTNTLMSSDNETPGSGLARVSMIKTSCFIKEDGGAANLGFSTAQRKLGDPHFMAVSMGTNILLMQEYQKTIINGITPVTSNTLTFPTKIRLGRGATTGGGGYGSYFIGNFLTYAEIRTYEMALEQLMISTGRLSLVDQCICFGDSITFGTGASAYTNRYAYVLSGLFGIQERNLGISSSLFRIDTTIPGGYPRRSELQDYNFRGTNSKIIIQYGVNDYANGTGVTSDFTTKLVTLVNELVAAGANVANIQIGSPSLVNDGTSTATQQAFRDACSAAAHTSGCKFVDVWQGMTDNGGLTLLNDTKHPNDAGHSIIANWHFSHANFV